MKSLINISAVFLKQLKDSLKNKLIIFIFFMFPIMCLIFKYVLEAPIFENIVLPMFINMNALSLPFMCASNIIAEDKEKGSLKNLIMANVKGWEYLIGIGLTMFTLSFISTSIFLFYYDLSSLNVTKVWIFFFSSFCSIIISILIGSIFGLISKNQMSSAPIASPLFIFLGMLPTLSKLNEDLETFSKIFYSHHTYSFFTTLSFEDVNYVPFLSISLNFIVCLAAFIIIYKIIGNKEYE